MTIHHFDGSAEYARRGQARNGSPFAADRTFRRPVSFGRLVFRAVRDLLALLALIGLAFVVASAFPQLF